MFAGWLVEPAPVERFFTDGLIVLDANVLLDLYRITPRAYVDVISVLEKVQDRLWIPHQAAHEFARNRESVLRDRKAEFGMKRTALKRSVDDALNTINTAVDQLVAFRERNRATRHWTREGASLQRNDIKERLEEILMPAQSELSRLELEYDSSPNSVRNDDIISKIDNLIRGRIGPKYSDAEFRAHVEYALNFRFPNKIPPGFRDAGKDSPLRAAGDYLLWRQTLDQASRISGDTHRLVMLVTGDEKDDWWIMDSKGRPTAPIPELVQEMWDTAGARLHLVSVKDLLAGAQEYLETEVAETTISELQEVDIENRLADIFGSRQGPINLLELSPADFERLIIYVLEKTGLEVVAWGESLSGLDMIAVNDEISPIGVEIKMRRCRVNDMQRFIHHLRSRDISSGIFVAPTFGADALEIAAREGVRTTDAAQLVEQLASVGVSAFWPHSPAWRPPSLEPGEYQLRLLDETDHLFSGEISDD